MPENTGNIALPSPESDGMEQKLDGLLTVLGHYEDFKDPFRPAFGRAYVYDLMHDGPLRGFTLDTWAERPDMRSSQTAHQVMRCIQYDRFGYDPEYPYRTEVGWHSAVDDIFNDPSRYVAFMYNMRHRELQSNIPDRYRGLKSFMALAHDLGRLTTRTVCDGGCGLNIGLKYYASGKSFSPTEIILPAGYGGDEPAEAVAARYGAAHQSLLDGAPELGPSVGIDREDLAQPVRWPRACSFYPEELLDRDRVATFDELQASSFDNVGFYRGDFADMDDDDFKARHGEKHDIVHLSTMLYQAPQAALARMLVRAMEYAEEFVVVQDFAHVDRQSGIGIAFYDDWQGVKYPYRTMILDMKEDASRQRWQEIFQWTDGRTRTVRFVDAHIISGHTGESVSLWAPLHERAQAQSEPAGIARP